MQPTEEFDFLGLDESNHGRFPEVYVAVVSRNPEDIISSQLGKRRKCKDISLFLENRDFKHILIPEEFAGIFTIRDTRLIAYIELIKAFGNPSKVIIDGEMLSEEIRRLRRYLPHHVSISIEPKADVHYPLVNCADAIANHLFRYYTKKSSERKDRYISNLIIPRKEDYLLDGESKL